MVIISLSNRIYAMANTSTKIINDQQQSAVDTIKNIHILMMWLLAMKKF